MLIEVMYACNIPDANTMVNETCMPLQYQVVDHYMNALNADLILLNNTLKED